MALFNTTTPSHGSITEAIRKRAFRYRPNPSIDSNLPIISSIGVLNSTNIPHWIRLDFSKEEKPMEAQMKAHMEVEEHIDRLSMLIFETQFNIQKRREELVKACNNEINQTIERIARLESFFGKCAINKTSKILMDAFEKKQEAPLFFHDTFPDNPNVDIAVSHADFCINEAFRLCDKNLGPLLLDAGKKGLRAICGHLAICFKAAEFWPESTINQSFENIRVSLTRWAESKKKATFF
jgi:hypothetical protein